MAVRLTAAAIRKGVKKCRVCKQIKTIGEFITSLDNKWMPNDCLECERKRSRERYLVEARRGYDRVRQKKYTEERPDECEVCKRTVQICYDHCHITNLHRGWLCHKCNSILGWADDDPDILRNLAIYLDKFYTSEAILRLLKLDYLREQKHELEIKLKKLTAECESLKAQNKELETNLRDYNLIRKIMGPRFDDWYENLQYHTISADE